MEIGIIVAVIIIAIFFWLLIKDFWEKQERGEIVIYRNNYDLFFNAIVYILPALVFFIDKPGFNNALCYVLLCIGFSIFMCVSAWDSNNTIVNKILASIIKIISGIEAVFVLAILLLLLLLIYGGSDNNRRGRRRRW